jgi:hypothetical protein
MGWKNVTWRMRIGVHGLGCVLDAKIFACGAQIAPLHGTFRDGSAASI